MAEIIRMPDLSGDGKTGGVIIKWKKKVGESVSAGEEFLTFETDKATADFEAYEGGILLYVGFGIGQRVLPNEVVAVIGMQGENAEMLIRNDNLERLNKK